jgi:hypothetical protein
VTGPLPSQVDVPSTCCCSACGSAGGSRAGQWDVQSLSGTSRGTTSAPTVCEVLRAGVCSESRDMPDNAASRAVRAACEPCQGADRSLCGGPAALLTPYGATQRGNSSEWCGGAPQGLVIHPRNHGSEALCRPVVPPAARLPDGRLDWRLSAGLSLPT